MTVGFVTLYLALLIVNPIHLASFTLIARMLGCRVEEISVFAGPTVLRRSMGSMILRFRLLPVGGYIKYSNERSANDSNAPYVVSLILGSLSMLVAPIIVLGFERWLDVSSTVFLAPFLIAISPLNYGVGYVDRALDLAAANSFVSTAALVSMQLAALQLMPIPWSNCGNALLMAARTALKIPDVAYSLIMTLGLLLVLYMVSTWTIAVLATAWQRI